jgi:hypothetical protein
VSDVSRRELVVARQERKLQEKEEESTRKFELKNSELETCANDLSTREAAMAVEVERLKKAHEDLFTCELTITSQEGILEHRAIELASKERASH